ncbi:response regulator transcription factor [Erysipelothrix anatis]|uniref:response regulator transcription factor n=1 Tax=Erysipelothrix anatis TaxID=2683713 RepID=UPI00135B0CAE|nr:response regulator transcription factor [Erysipelothrix anatis]
MNLLIIDDDPIVSMSLQTIIEASGDIKVLAIGNDGEQALELYQKHKPDILLTDIQMKHTNGIDAGKAIIQFDPHAKIVYLTTFVDDEYVSEALKLGAKGYLLKQDFAGIVPALRSVASNHLVFGDTLISKIHADAQEFSDNSLNEKEIQLLKHIAEGLNNKEISEISGYSEGTVRNNVSLLLEKLNLRDRTQLAIYYYKNK